MTPETHQQLDSHVRAIAQILYDDAQATGLPMDSLEAIEHTVRAQLQSHVSPGLGNFLSKQIVQKRVSEQGES